MNTTEARIDDTSNVLVALEVLRDNELVREFFGSTIAPEDLASGSADLTGKTVYLCGDVSAISARQLGVAAGVFVTGELWGGYREDVAWPLIDLGGFPARVQGVGVYYRRYFDLGADHFG